jgi:ADP-sugar diphosphatase
MLDGNSFKGTAATEIAEEANLAVHEDELINMSELAASSSSSPSETLQTAIYPSPGACDEFIPLLLCQKRLTRNHMEWLKGKATGLRDEGENITLKLVPLRKAWKEGGRDGKTLAALALYQGLKEEGKIPEMGGGVEEEPGELNKS